MSDVTCGRPRNRLGRMLDHWMGAPAILGVLAVFVVMVLCLLSPSLLGGKILSSGNAIFFLGPFSAEKPASLVRPANSELTDPLEQFQPDLLVIRRALESGELGLWTQYQAAGRPMWASQQAAPLFPLTWLALVLPFWHALAWIAALKLCLAALGIYLFGRWLGLRRGPALLSAVVYAFCTFLNDGLQFPTSTVMLMSPWVMLMAGRVGRRGKALDAIGLTLAVGLLLLAGSPELIAIALGGVVFYALYELLRGASVSESDKQPSRPRRLALLAGAGVGGMALSGAVLLPFVEFLGVANSTSRAGAGGYPNSIAYAFFFPELWGRPDKAIGQFGPINYTERTAYFGALPLLLAIGGVFAHRPRREHLFWIVFTVVAVLIAMNTFLQNFVAGLPGPSNVKLLRTLLLVELGGAVLAGMGLQAWFDADARQRRRMMTAMILAGVAPVAFLLRDTDPFSHFFAALGQLPSLSREAVSEKSFIKQVVAWRWLVFGGVGLGLLAAARRIPHGLVILLVVILTAVDLITMNSGFNPQIAMSEANPPTPSALAYAQAHVGHDRISGMIFPGSAELPANLAERYGLRDIQTYDFPESKRWASLWSAYGQPLNSQNDWNSTEPKSHLALDAFAVKYVFPPAGTRGPLWLKPVYEQSAGSQLVLENTSALPCAWVAYDWRTASSQASATVLTVASSREELYREPVLEEAPQSPAKGAGIAPATASFVVDREERARLKVDVRHAGYLILDDSYYPGWEATVDGRKEKILPANENFRAVAVTPGVDTIEFRYRPASFRVGAILSILTAVGLLVALMALLVRRRVTAAGQMPPRHDGSAAPPGQA